MLNSGLPTFIDSFAYTYLVVWTSLFLPLYFKFYDYHFKNSWLYYLFFKAVL